MIWVVLTSIDIPDFVSEVEDDSCLTALNVRCILKNATVSQPIWVWYISHILNVNKNSSKGDMKSWKNQTK